MRRSVLLLGVFSSFLATFAPVAKADDKPFSSWFSPALLLKGLSLIPKGLLINAEIDYRPTANIDFRASLNLGPVSLFGSVVNNGPTTSQIEEMEKRRAEVLDRLGKERNSIERDKLEVFKRQLEVQIAQAKVAMEQLVHAKGVFEYQKLRDESLLRRLKYSLAPDKLVVVVADFSDGGSGEGVQLADEIANALGELKSKCGISFETLVGEIQKGSCIRSEHMARDLGQHFPVGTCYAVVWGTLSPRTVGKFRPHVTYVMKTSENEGVSTTYTIDLVAQDLPLQNGDEASRRIRHEELVAFTCAVIPGCYGAYELSRERTPDFAKLLEYLGKGSEGAKRFEDALSPLRKWPDIRKNRFEYLTRMSRVGLGAVIVNTKPVEVVVEYPQVVLNSNDNSIMTLITEPGSHKPMQFDDPDAKQKYIAYIDTKETAWLQYLEFCNKIPMTSRLTDGVPWLKFEPEFTNVKIKEDGQLDVLANTDRRRPVFNVTYPGALAYCQKMGKALPRKAEWQMAARGVGGKYPWGDEFKDASRLCCCKSSIKTDEFPTQLVGSFANSDRSAIGCVDMAGNVAEWCEEFDDNAKARRVVCGGSFNDELEKKFDITQHRNESPDIAQRWIGFRGVVRIPIPQTGP